MRKEFFIGIAFFILFIFAFTIPAFSQTRGSGFSRFSFEPSEKDQQEEDLSSLDSIDLQETIQKQDDVLKEMSEKSKKMHDETKDVISNIR